VKVASTHPRAAEVLRATAVRREKPDPVRLRRLVLQRLWRTHLSGLSQTSAARVLAAEWAEWRPGDGEAPGSIADGFDRLHRAGIRRRSIRTIIPTWARRSTDRLHGIAVPTGSRPV
jgi:hypothetical protein